MLRLWCIYVYNYTSGLTSMYVSWLIHVYHNIFGLAKIWSYIKVSKALEMYVFSRVQHRVKHCCRFHKPSRPFVNLSNLLTCRKIVSTKSQLTCPLFTQLLRRSSTNGVTSTVTDSRTVWHTGGHYHALCVRRKYGSLNQEVLPGIHTHRCTITRYC